MNEKKFYRVRNGSMIAGVCSGIGAYLNIDPNLIRIICVTGCCIGGLPIIAYILAALFLPELPTAQDMPSEVTFTSITPDTTCNTDTTDSGKDII